MKRIYWIDRCLGSEILPAALRVAGIEIRTYADLYPNDPKVSDHVWIPDVAQRECVRYPRRLRPRSAAYAQYER